MTYQVRHDHVFGSCNGRLIVEPARVLFESITAVDHSRQWSLKDIKERNATAVRHQASPFSGDEYNLGIQGRGMDSGEYNKLVDQITAARAQR
jgi:hypothetical protein